MPEIDVINQFVDPAALQAQKELALKSLQEIVDKIDTVNTAFGNSKGINDLNKALATLKNYTDEASKAAVSLTAAQSKLEFQQSAAGQAALRDAQATAEATKAAKTHAQATNDQINAFKKLEAEYEQLKQKALDLGAKYGQQSQAFKDAAKAADETRTKMNGLKEAVGDHTQYVGWYEKAWQGVTGAFFAVTGAIAAATGAIKFATDAFTSNEAGMDRWKVITEQAKESYQVLLTTIKTGDWSNFLTNIREAIKEGERYQEVLNELEKKKRSVDVGASADRAKIDEYRVYARSGLKGGNELTLEGRKAYAQAALDLEAKIMRDKKSYASEDVNNEMEHLRSVTKLNDDELTTYIAKYGKEGQLSEAALAKNAEITKKINDLNSVKAVVTGSGAGMRVDASPQVQAQKELNAYVLSLSDEERAVYRITKATEEGALDSKFIDKTAKSMEGLNSVTSEYWSNVTRMTTLKAKLDKGIFDEGVNAEKDKKKQLKDRVTLEKEAQDLISQYKLGTLSDQMAQEMKEVEASEGFKELKREDAEKAEQVLQAIHDKYGALALKQLADQVAKEKKIRDDETKAIEDTGEEKISGVVLSVTKDKNKDLTDLRKQLENKQITIEEFKIKEKEINQKYDELILTKKLEILEDELAAEEDAGEVSVSLEQKIYDLKLAILNKGNADFTANLNDEKAKKEKSIKDKETLEKAIINVSKQGLDDLGGMLSESYQTDLDKYTKAQDAKKTSLKSQLDQGLITKQQYDAKITQIDHDTAKKQAESAKKQADIAIAVALVNTAASLATSIATAISAAEIAGVQSGIAAPIVTPLLIVELVGDVLAGFASVYSAIQKSQSVQIPGYEKGREGGPAEWAIIHPGELRGKDGKYYPTPDRPALTFLSHGESVIPRPDVEAMTRNGLLSGMGNSVMLNFGTKSLEDKVENLQNGFRMVCRTISEQPGAQFNITEKGIFTVVKKGNSTYEYHKKNTP